MTLCAVRDCTEPAAWLMVRNGDQERPACTEHAARAATTGYQRRRLRNPELAAALEGLRTIARARAAAEAGYWDTFAHARAAGASYRQLAGVTGLSRFTTRHHCKRLATANREED